MLLRSLIPAHATMLTIPAMLLSLTVLTGCSETSSTPTTPSTSASPTPSTSAPMPPVMPEAATKPGKQGAEAFIRHYYAVMDWASSTGSTRELDRLSIASCAPCSKSSKLITDLYLNGVYSTGGQHHIINILASKRSQESNASFWQAGIAMEIDAQKVVAGNTQGVRKYPSGSRTVRVYLIYRDLAWRVSDWVVIA